MRLLRKSLPLILIASALLLSAESKVSGSNEKHQDQTTAHKPGGKNKYQAATPSFTIVVQPAPVQIIQPSRAIEQNKPKQKWYQRPTITDWGILGVTLLYALTSLGLLNATRKQAALARKSADVAEKAFTGLEVPYVSIGAIIPHVLRKNLEEGQVGPSPNAVVWFEFGFRNSGRALAEVTSVHGELRIVDVLTTPAEYSGTIEESAFPIGPNSDTGKVRWNATYKFPLGKIDEEFLSLLSGKTRLVCFGYIRYRDAFKTKWITGFGWQWNPYNNGVYLVGGRYYNYSRKDAEDTGLSEPE